jgi:hypothetical protein
MEIKMKAAELASLKVGDRIVRQDYGDGLYWVTVEKRIADDAAAALAANADVAFAPIGKLGEVEYHAANVVNANGRPCFVVVGVVQKVEYSWRYDTKTLVWVGTLNYAEDRGDEYGPNSMASCSPDLRADTLPELFQAAIVRVW